MFGKKEEKKKKIGKAEDVKLSRVFYHYWKFGRKYKWWYLLITLGFAIGNVLFTVVSPYFSKILINSMSNGESLEKIWFTFFIIILLFLVSSIFLRASTAMLIKYQMKGMVDLYNYVFKKITKYPNSFFENNFVGALVNKLEKFVIAFEVIMDIFMQNIFLITAQIIASVTILYYVNHQIGIIFFIWFIFYIVINIWFVRKLLTIDYKKAQTITKRVGTMADVITNVLNLKIFSSQKSEIINYKKVTDKTRVAVLRSWNFSNYQEIAAAVLFLILEVCSIGYAIKLWSIGEISVGDVVLIQTYFALFLASLWSIGRSFKRLIQAISDAKEMVQILDQKVEVQDVKNAKKLEVQEGKIVFDEATFSYPNQKEGIFNKFNLKIPAGQSLGLVGTSGAGKTTITKLLLRFSNLKSGQILIDGQDISQVTQDSLRENIAYVPQEPVLFHRSIYENIAYAKSGATKAEVIEASKKAHVDEFVNTLENGYETMVGERGVKLSGGQKQRVALARAFLKNAPILVLDEATSALDSVSEEFIQDALFKLMEGKTVIVVAHRLSTIQRLDKILVIEDGVIEEEGSHQELLEKKGIYQRFWHKQTTRFSYQE